MADRRAFDVVSADFPENLRRGKRYGAPHVRQSAVGGHEGQAIAGTFPHNSENADVDAVPEILLAKIFGYLALLLNRADVVFLPAAEGEPALGGERGDASENGLVRRIKLNENELAVHRAPLEIVSIR